MDNGVTALQHSRAQPDDDLRAPRGVMMNGHGERDLARKANMKAAPRVLALAAGAVAAGALALGAVAIGQMVIGRLVIGRARFKSLEVDELTVRKLRIVERDDASS